MAKKITRTTLRSSTGKKLYAVREKTGAFKEIQTFENAHRADLAKKSSAEKTKDRLKLAMARKTAGKKTVKK